MLRLLVGHRRARRSDRRARVRPLHRRQAVRRRGAEVLHRLRPKLFGRTVNGTEYVVSAIPLGGFVKMVGEDPDATEPVDPRSPSRIKRLEADRHRRGRPGVQSPVAFIAFTLVFVVYGERVPSEVAKVGGLIAGMPAAQAGLQTGDMVTAVDGKPVRPGTSCRRPSAPATGKTIDSGGETRAVRLRSR